MAMYYSDHVAVAEKEITSSNFCCLVDAAVMLYEEEEHLKGKSKCHSTEKKSCDKKRRTFVATRRNTQQNPNGAYETRNPLHGPSSSSSSSPLFLGDYRIPRNPNSLSSLSSCPRNTQRNPLHGSSSSSSSPLFLGDFKIPRNPNPDSSLSSCLTEDNKSRKRRAAQGSERTGNTSKKAKVSGFSWIGRETPEWLTLSMKDTKETVKWGERNDLRLIFERTLFKTDVNPSECRLSMPFNELIRKDFLTSVESRIIEEDINRDKKSGVGAILVDQRNVKWGVMLKRWEMKKDSGKGSWNFALTCGWNDIVEANGLKLGDRISVWSFRWGGLLCFAIVTPPPSMAQSSSSLCV